ncbi:hypothetical protein [Streptomyces sp. NPDC060027]|uniref:hypothetical protein n=1 Tax=Streptomyces sp. NPDC060027 TaxID=3347040 RepID=UPI00368E0FF2
MTRPSLLRRAAAATLGTTAHPTRTTALTPALELRLARRAAAAVIGIRSYSHQTAERAAAAGPSPPVGNSPKPSRVWEIRRPTDSTTRRSILTAPPPQAEKATATAPAPTHRDSPGPDPSDWLTVVLDPASPVVIGKSDTPAQQHRPRPTLALAATAAVLAIAFTAFGYQLRPLVHRQTPSHSVGSNKPSPTPVVNGDVPEAYLGSWSTTITNAPGENTRSLVIKQGHIGDDVLILVADGPAGNDTYHCVFTASLTAAPSGTSRLKLGPSTVTSGTPLASCAPGGTSTLILKNDNSLRRTIDSSGEALTYTRTR